jgi:hypothetical protein
MKIKFIRHADITKELLIQIAVLKKYHWKYALEEHLNWMKENLNLNDIHVVMENDNSELIAYLNLVNISITLNDNENDFLGIGNVCVNVKNRGYGSMLLKEVNGFIYANNLRGALLCKDVLAPFYQLNDWELVEKSKTSTNLQNTNICIFNVNEKINNLEYKGRFF